MNRRIEKNKTVKRVRSKSREDSAAEAKSLSAAIIQYLLLSLKVKSTEVGEILGLSRYSIWRIKKGERCLRITDILRLARAVGMSVHELIEAAEYKPKALQPEYDALNKALRSSPSSGRKRNRA